MSVDALAGYGGRWWIAGGWAVDIFVGGEPREHADLDIAVVRAEQELLREHFRDWDVHWVPRPGTLEPWDGTPVEPPRHELWARRAPSAPWELELLLNDVEDEVWAFRRDPRVRRPVEEIGLDCGGLPVLAPEIALLYKAKVPTATDERDFAHALPALPASARRWLGDALDLVHPGHPWQERLA